MRIANSTDKNLVTKILVSAFVPLKEDNSKLSFDVGCMLFDYKPIEFEEVQKIMSKKVWKAIDHHGK